MFIIVYILITIKSTFFKIILKYIVIIFNSSGKIYNLLRNNILMLLFQKKLKTINTKLHAI